MLVLNGDSLDFGPLPAGSTLPRAAIACDWIAGDVTRDADGLLTVPLILPHGANAPSEALFATPVNARDGKVDLPPFDSPADPEMTHED